jgi:hypothetical protein
MLTVSLDHQDVPSLISEAGKFAMKQFIQADSLEEFKNFKSWEEFQTNRLMAAVKLVERFPWAPRLYFRFRDDPGFMGSTIREVEEEWIKGQRKAIKYYCSDIPAAKNEKVAGPIKLGFLWSIAIQTEEKGREVFDAKEKEALVKRVALLASDILSGNI